MFDNAAVADGRLGLFDWILDYDQGNTGRYTAAEGDLINLSEVLLALNPFGTLEPLNTLVRAEADTSGSYSVVYVKDLNDGSWIPIARLDGIHAGNVLSLKLDPFGTGAATQEVIVEPAVGDPPPEPKYYGTAGDDVVVGTEGNDTFVANFGNDSIDGLGGAEDTLIVQLNLSASSGSGVSYTINGTALSASSSYDAINDAMRGPLGTFTIKLGSLGQTTTVNVEKVVVDLTGTPANDLLICQNGFYYDGAGGTDTFFANWGTTTADINWVNDPAKLTDVNGITIGGVERLLISTGTGNDVISLLSLKS